ncbi:MAG TPA: lycopene beta-cyclase CrtY [Polyangia bacterium]|jgi:lycopene beta-cyclase
MTPFHHDRSGEPARNFERAASACYETVVVGGGLAGGLIALALAEAGRGDEVLLLEREPSLGGNHTWSFHDTDLDAPGRRLIADLVTHHWPRHEVRFPDRARTVEAGYTTVSSARFAQMLPRRLTAAGVTVRLGQDVAEIASSMVRLADQTVVRGELVIDARGPVPAAEGATIGFQKFVGLEVELAADGPWTMPLMMDATVPQRDGYRFTYVLPFSPRRALIEDTIYSDNPRLDPGECERGILAYAQRHGAAVAHVVRREVGVLPLPLRAPADAGSGPLRVGYRGGFFHSVTGYSLPLAVRLALAIARATTAPQARAAVAALARELEPQHRFGRLLNRLMFEALPPAARWRAFERFYRLPEATIARFYACRSTWRDRARVLVGRPPAGISWSRLLGARARKELS